MKPESLNYDDLGLTILTLLNALDQTADHVMITDKDGIIQYVNPAFEKTTGYFKEETIGQTPRILRSGKHAKEYYERLWSTILAGRIFYATTVNKKRNGELYYADQSITPIKDQSGEITHFVSVWKDITERMLAEEELRKLNDRLEVEKNKLEQVLSIEEKLNTIVHIDRLIDFIVDRTAKVLEAQRCSLMFVDEHSGELCVKGYQGPDEETVRKARLRMGDPIAGLIAEEGLPVLVVDIEEDKRFSRKNRPSCKTKSFVSVPIKLGHTLIGVISATDKDSIDGQVFSKLDLKILCMIARQVAVAIENAKLYRELKYLTMTDPITNMPNYRYFTKSLDHEIRRAKRYAGALCLLMMDVDDFKSYNDDFGHLEGDHLLKSIAHVLNENLREVDIACRYAGDEFVAILPETDLTEGRIVAEKIRKKIECLELKREVTMSIGIAKYTFNMTRHDLILQADTLLYHAKKEGKNKVQIDIKP